VKFYVLGCHAESCKANFVLKGRPTIVWDMTSCNLAEVTDVLPLSSGRSITLERNRQAQDSVCLPAWSAYSAYTSTLKMDAAHSSETPISVYHTAWCHISEESTFYSLRHENLKSSIQFLFLSVSYEQYSLYIGGSPNLSCSSFLKKGSSYEHCSLDRKYRYCYGVYDMM
jgi:hypothetical protein